MRMPAPSVLVRSKRELAGDTTSTDPRSQRIRESRKGRPCNELGLSAHCLSAACPHLRAPGAPCPGWAHHIAVSFRKQEDNKTPTDHIPDNGKAERFVQTSLREWAYAHAYDTSKDRADALPVFLHRYNWHRPHGGIGAKTPISRIPLTGNNVLRLHS